MECHLNVAIPGNCRRAEGILLEFVNRIEEQQLGVNTLVVLQKGESILEFWRKPYRRDCPQLLFSTTKLFTSVAVGIAWDAGLLKMDDAIIDFFSDKLPETVSANLKKMSIHHLLSMNTGHHHNKYNLIYPDKDWVKGFLAQQVEHEPGTHYCYSTHASHVLAAIVEKVTGQRMVDFLMPRLFEPLGIQRPSWEIGPDGITAGGMGLSLSTDSVAKFGQMLLERGVFRNRRIVSEEYIRLATTKHSDNSDGAKEIDDAQGYGYHVQLCRSGCFRHTGSFGQLCFVAPQEKVVVAVTSMKRNFQELSDLIYECLLTPRLTEARPAENCCGRLKERLANMSSPMPLRMSSVLDGIPVIGDCSYHIDENADHLIRLHLILKNKLLQCEFIYADKDKRSLLFNFDEPVHSRDTFVKDILLHEQEILNFACWQEKNVLKLTVIYLETPYITNYTITFTGNCIELEFQMNVSLTKRNFTASGKRIDE